jgi:hypothetical protein
LILSLITYFKLAIYLISIYIYIILHLILKIYIK